jgi:endoglucanase
MIARARLRPVTAALTVLAPLALGSSLFGAHTPTLGAAPANPLSGSFFYVDAHSNAARQVQAWKGSRPSDAQLLEQIALQPQADWFGDWNKDVKSDVAARMREIRGAGAMPVLVAYAIPGRDCGQYSKGGMGDAQAYGRWIKAFSDGIGDGKAIVILEPDALAGADCLSASAREARMAMLRDAVATLKSKSGTHDYIDAGNPSWKSVQEIAARLKGVGVEHADGFSLNVSNTIGTQQNMEYGRKVSAAVGGAHFVIDTSRNGAGAAPKGEWCNPVGRALGLKPTTDTGDGLVDAFLWVKRPGESDGTCHGGPAAGKWWPEYALALARAAQGRAA